MTEIAAKLDRRRLSKLLGMLGSAHDGEVLAAARKAERLRRGAGLSWVDVLMPAPDVIAFDDAIELCESYADLLTVWERGFVASLSRQQAPVSAKQETVLRQILAKVRAAEASAA